ncbi:uncharacterized protein LOC127858039 [Dreissena polymorpha]|uniref:Uncharacterized protein n=1 Tax=Dreissena polymorpha TaxID=45954 RepID=A0A9D4NDG0_DREPO|nr:uncharacterized protein LOC127858039 [Dreissena polymorpha]KAH3892626.1 hypothetical protein DPMN_016747 [Dreissena polymorpha]
MAVSSVFFNVLMLCALTCSIICTEHREAEEDINKCNDGVCLAKDSFIRDDLDKLHNYQDDAALESQLMLQTMTTVEMYRAQREVAQYLEMALLMSADHADVAKEIRITAHESRSQHLMTSGLMKNFAVTALDIVSRKIPKLFVGLKMKKPPVIKTILNQILATAEEMKTETEYTRKRYYDLHGQVQNNIITVNTKTNDNRKKSDELKVRMEKEKQQAKLAKEQEHKLGKTKADLDKDIQKLKQKRDNLYGSAKREQENRKDHTFKFGHSMGGIGFILDLFGNIFTHIFGGNDNYYQEIMKKYREADESLRRTMEGQEDIIDQIRDKRANALISLENRKKNGSSTRWSW